MTIQQMLLASSSGGPVTLANAGNVNGNPQQQEITVSNFINSGGTLIIPSGLYVWSDDTSTPALTVDISCTIINQGNIMGRGGNGGSGNSTVGSDPSNVRAGGDGGSAIKINSGVSGVVITNEYGGNIFGGGGGGVGGYYAHTVLPRVGGGGGGAGGGDGGNGRNSSSNGGSGGDIGSAGSNGTGHRRGTGGDHGGSAASSDGLGGSGTTGGGGGGGGRKITGSTAVAPNPTGSFRSTGGSGAYNNSPGGNPSVTSAYASAGGGGGGYGASGGYISTYESTPSDGGKAIDDSNESYTLTNNGTIYGGT